MQQSSALDKVFQRARIPLTLVDAGDAAQPLLRVNDLFCETTGYSRGQCIGHNCRFLQGTDLQQPARFELRAALDKQEDIQVVLRNYTRLGDPFDSLIFINHIRDLRSEIVYILGSQFVIHDRESAESLDEHLGALDQNFATLASAHRAVELNVKRQISASTSAMLHSAVLQDRLADWSDR